MNYLRTINRALLASMELLFTNRIEQYMVTFEFGERSTMKITIYITFCTQQNNI